MPSTLTEMISMIQFRLGRRKDLATEIEREIQLAQKRLEDDPRLEPWFLVRRNSAVAVTAGANAVPLPSDFIRFSEEQAPLISVDGAWNFLARKSGDDIISSYQGGTGTPTAWNMYGTAMEVWPTPDVDYTVRLTYHGSEPVLDTITPVDSNAWTVEAFDLLMNKALLMLAQSLGNERVYKNATNDFNTALAALQTQIVQREEAQQDYQRMPGSGDQMTER